MRWRDGVTRDREANIHTSHKKQTYLCSVTPPLLSYTMRFSVFTETKFSLTGRIQVARVKGVAERIMLNANCEITP